MTRGPGARGSRRPTLIPALPRPAWVVLGGDFLSAIGSGLTLPCLFIYARQVRDLSYGQAGLVVAMIALASLAGNPLGGAMADRWTPRRALMAGLVMAAAGSVALALAGSAAALFGAAGLLGLGVAMCWRAASAAPRCPANGRRRPGRRQAIDHRAGTVGEQAADIDGPADVVQQLDELGPQFSEVPVLVDNVAMPAAADADANHGLLHFHQREIGALFILATRIESHKKPLQIRLNCLSNSSRVKISSVGQAVGTVVRIVDGVPLLQSGDLRRA